MVLITNEITRLLLTLLTFICKKLTKNNMVINSNMCTDLKQHLKQYELISDKNPFRKINVTKFLPRHEFTTIIHEFSRFICYPNTYINII